MLHTIEDFMINRNMFEPGTDRGIRDMVELACKGYLAGEHATKVIGLKAKLKDEGTFLRGSYTGKIPKRSLNDLYSLEENGLLYIGAPDSIDTCWGCHNSAKTLGEVLVETNGGLVKEKDVRFVNLKEKQFQVGFLPGTKYHDLPRNEKEVLHKEHLGGYLKNGAKHFDRRCYDDFTSLAIVMVEYGANSVNFEFSDAPPIIPLKN